MMINPPIIPCLWFDHQGEEAAAFYASIFPDAKVGTKTRYPKAGHEIHGRSEGAVMTVEFRLAGRDFLALNAGPIFKFTPAVSFLVTCASRAEVDSFWSRLADGGDVLMPLDTYDWSERYGWLTDRFGLSWQIMLLPAAGATGITPVLMFTREQAGRAEEALTFYTGIFPAAGIEAIHRYGPDAPEPEDNIKFARFTLAGQGFAAMDSRPHAFGFTEAISFQVLCDSQSTVDHYWEGLRAGGPAEAQQCGWLKDRFGLSWQIVPAILPRLLAGGDAAGTERTMETLLQMKKLDIAALEAAHAGWYGGDPTLTTKG